MFRVSCEQVDASMSDRLRATVEDLLISRDSDALRCQWEGSAPSADALLEALTDHVREMHAMRSWPPEYWVHLRSCIQDVD